MSDQLAAIALGRKQERWASYKEMRAISSQLSDLTKHRMSIDSFRLPDGFTVRRVQQGEVRVLGPDGVALLVEVAEGAATDALREMPLDISTVVLPLLVLILDQGGSGAAPSYFALGALGLMLSVRWDSFHRGVNDVKGATLHACEGVFRRVLLLTTYVFNINYGPRGKGTFFQDKKGMLRPFMNTENSRSPLSPKYALPSSEPSGRTLSLDR